MTKETFLGTTDENFVPPTTIEEARNRITALKIEKTEIGTQLQDKNSHLRKDPSWAPRAQLAIKHKRREISLLHNWIINKQPSKRSVRFNNFDLIDHMRLHQKAFGALTNVLVAARAHVLEETDETFHALETALKEAEEIEASE